MNGLLAMLADDSAANFAELVFAKLRYAWLGLFVLLAIALYLWAGRQRLAAIERLGARLLFLDDADYPPMLAELDNAPPALIVRGVRAPGIRSGVRGRWLRRLVALVAVLLVVAFAGYTVYVGAVGSDVLAHPTPAAVCATPEQLSATPPVQESDYENAFRAPRCHSAPHHPGGRPRVAGYRRAPLRQTLARPRGQDGRTD